MASAGIQTVGSIAAVAGDAEWLAHRFDPANDAIQFLRVPRSLHGEVTFLTDDYLPAGLPMQVVRRPEAMAAAPPPAPLHFIFHSAFCLSTLLARALNLPGRSMALKEPVVLNDVVGWRLRGAAPGQVGGALDDALTLLARPFAPGEAVVIKPSNVVNGLAAAMLGMRPGSKALLLHAPLGVFLRSVAKKGLDGRLWVRELMAKQLREGLINLGLEGEDYLRLTDLQAAAVGWLAQHAAFHALIARYPGRVASLDSEALLARPAEHVAALGRLFGLTLGEAEVAAIVAGPAFTTHSKSGAAFGGAERADEYAAAARAHADEIEKVTVWAEAVAANVGIAMTLGAPLA
jgi:hypothetical protein